MTMNRQSYREHIINVHPNKNPLDMKVYGEKTFAETMALLRGATVTRGRLRGPGGSGMTGGGGMAGHHKEQEKEKEKEQVQEKEQGQEQEAGSMDVDYSETLEAAESQVGDISSESLKMVEEAARDEDEEEVA